MNKQLLMIEEEFIVIREGNRLYVRKSRERFEVELILNMPVHMEPMKMIKWSDELKRLQEEKQIDFYGKYVDGSGYGFYRVIQ